MTSSIDTRADTWTPPDENVLPHLLRWREEGLQTALITVMSCDNSSAPGPGSQMAAASDGRAVGYISGGSLETAILAEAWNVIDAGKNRLVRYGRGAQSAVLQLPCGGGLDIYFDQSASTTTIERVLENLSARRPSALRTDLATGATQLVDTPPRETTFDGKIFIRVYRPRLRLLIAGTAPPAATLARLAHAADMEVEVLSPETRVLAECARYGVSARELTEGRAPGDLILDPWTAGVLLFHDHAWEADLLPLLLESQCFYLGAVGNRTIHETRLNRLARAGFGERAAARLRGPIGLIPNASSPVELSLSILAEVVAVAKARGVM